MTLSGYPGDFISLNHAGGLTYQFATFQGKQIMHNFPFDAPISAGLTGQCTIEMSGVWPWKSVAKVREMYNSL